MESKPIITEEKRELDFLKVSINPIAEIWQLLQKYSTAEKKKTDYFLKEQQVFVKSIGDQIHQIYKITLDEDRKGKEKNMVDQLNMVITSFDEILNSLGYAVQVFDGFEWKAIKRGEAEITEYLEKGDCAEAYVSETLQPMITYRNKIIQQAKVIVNGPLKNQKNEIT